MKREEIEMGVILWMSIVRKIVEETIQPNPPPKNPIKKYFWKREIREQVISILKEVDKEALSMLRGQRRLGQALINCRRFEEVGGKDFLNILNKIINEIIDEAAKNY